MSTLVASLSGPNDISVTTVSILNNQSTAVDIGVGSSKLSFSNTSVQSFMVVYNVVRSTTVEAGTMTGVWNGSAWEYSHEFTGDAGMDFEMTTAGQVQYFSDNTNAGTMTFRATTTLDQ